MLLPVPSSPLLDVDLAVDAAAMPSGLLELTLSVPVVDAGTPVREVDSLFNSRRELTAVIVEEQNGPALLPRDHLLFELSGRFGYGRSLYARATVGDLLPVQTLLLDSGCRITDAARLILARPADSRYHDVVVVSADGPRVLPVSAVFEHLALMFGHVAMHDPLTGLPNRRMLEQHGANLARHGIPTDRVAILYVDLDGFKAVNDTFGHRAGDELLVGFADRLRQSVRPTDVVARLGGDEFAALLVDVSAVEAHAVAERIVLTAAAPFVLDDEPLHISATVGVAMANDAGVEQELTHLDVLLRHADGAMLKAKRAGKSRVGTLRADTEDASGSTLARRGLIRRKLREALNHNQLSLHYQPKLDLVSGALTSVEALARWTDTELGPISPAEFIPIAEGSAQIHRIGQWVLHEACAQGSRWYAAGTPYTIAINVSPTQLATDTFVTEVLDALDVHGLPAALLRIEITEGAAVSDLGRTVSQLEALHRAGVQVDLDDFGTGYSSLAMLRKLPISSVKIDKSFIDDIDTDPANVLLVEGVIAAAHQLGLTVIAEGVERIEQLTTLTSLGCDMVQGYYIGRPMPAAALPQTELSA